jgi:NTE family protein
MRSKVGLVLSGGGAKGLAHIGVIKCLEKNNIPIDVITGSSAGAIVGGIYASGTSTENLEEIVLNLKYRKVTRLLFDPTLINSGLIKGKKINEFLFDTLTEKKIEKFPIKFGCVTTDIIKGRRFVITKGDASEAIRASMSVPGIFKAVKYQGVFLVDGGIIDPLPVEPAINLGAEVIIASDVSGVYQLSEEFKNGEKCKVIDVFKSTIMIVQKRIIELDLKNRENVVKINPDIQGIAPFKFGSKKIAEKAIKNGEKAVSKNLKEIKEMIKNYQKK